MNIQQTLKISTNKLKQKNTLSPSLDTEVLLLEALNKNKSHSNIKHGIAASLCGAPRNDNRNLDKTWLYLNNNYKLNKNEEKLFNNFINQRLKNKPVAYIINRKEFYGYSFYVDENVLIPRPETELIVEEVLKILNNFYPALAEGQRGFNLASKNFNLIDIGTGSGCIIISILNELEKIKNKKNICKSYANDISKEAIKIAKINSKKYNLNKKIKFITGDLEKVITEKIFSTSDQIIITANLPYIKDDDYKTLSLDIKKHEPKIALTAGENGLDYIEKLINLVSKIQLRLTQKIYLFLEADPDQMDEIVAIISQKLVSTDIEIIKDLSNNERIVKLLYCHPELVEG